ncbi:putative helicase [Thermogladius calderae 1633]|uniref:Putative helicase n=1 Tax=Thermogladius calderae (strain DSM 22663 / VKM B-2946 / 1633) TaxID=1184251 RepID=I3TFA0_THEC1|nr:CRISPR-associated helicase Cas3' [Thermogladius calderae]AFK51438.1 putative helicase [Thermogladius calderae 1633]
MKELVEKFVETKTVVLIAPTGYGKTLTSLWLFEEAYHGKIAAGLIHVVPYRALVKEIYLEKFKRYYNGSGYQSMDDVDPQGKSPYFLKKLVVTTLDSFVYNLYRVPVAEMFKVLGKEFVTHGHYYPLELSINTSTVVLDEAHIYLGGDAFGREEDSYTALLAALRYLLDLNLPLVVETATMHSSIIEQLVKIAEGKDRRVPIIYVGCGNTQLDNLEKLVKNGELIRICDSGFEGSHRIAWRTYFVDPSDLVGKVEIYCSKEPVLVIKNTVKSAVETYKALVERKACGGDVVLIHGLLSNKDRDDALRRIKNILENCRGAVVSTQVVEAGVEFGGRVLFTDPAPMENLAQRAGRLCRETSPLFGACKERGAEVHIIMPSNKTADEVAKEFANMYDEKRVRGSIEKISEVLKSGEEVEWRLLSNRDGYRSFAELLEEVGAGRILEYAAMSKSTILESYLKSDAQPDDLATILEKGYVKQLARSGVLVSVVVSNVRVGKPVNYKNLEVVAVELSKLIEYEEKSGYKCLETEIKKEEGSESRYLKVLIVKRVNNIEVFEERTSKDSTRNLMKANLIQAIKGLYPTAKRGESFEGVYLKAKEGCYKNGEGLLLWQ